MFSASNVIMVMYILNFIVRALYVTSRRATLNSAVTYDPSSVNWALVNLNLALAGFLIGYNFLGKAMACLVPVPSLYKIPVATYTILARARAVWLVGTFAHLMSSASVFRGQFAQGTVPVVSPISNLLSVIGNLTTLAIGIEYQKLVKEGFRPGKVLFLGIMIILEITWALLGGSRGNAIFVFFLGFLGFSHYLVRRLSIRTVLTWMSIAVLIFLLFILPVWNTYRELAFEFRGGTGTLISPQIIGEKVKAAFSSLTISSRGISTIGEGIEEVFNRFAGLDSLIAVVEKVPSVYPFQHGRTFVLFLWAFVPRAIWPGKPNVSLGREFALLFLGWSPHSRGEAAITNLGELYWNWGLPGIIFGMALVGLLTRLLYNTLVEKPGSGSIGALIYVIVLWHLASVEMSIAVYYFGLLEKIIILSLASSFIIKRPLVR